MPTVSICFSRTFLLSPLCTYQTADQVLELRDPEGHQFKIYVIPLSHSSHSCVSCNSFDTTAEMILFNNLIFHRLSDNLTFYFERSIVVDLFKESLTAMMAELVEVTVAVEIRFSSTRLSCVRSCRPSG